MSANSKIEWTDHTFNPWWGCAKVSPGCDHCYAEGLGNRFGTQWGVDAERREFGEKHWDEPRKWNAKAAAAGERHRVFCASMADVFDKNAPLGARERLWKLIDETPNLDWLLLTKRIGNAQEFLPARWAGELPLNIWLGISVVNQDEADRDIPKLLRVSAAVRFLSMEPLLGPVDLTGLWSKQTGHKAIAGPIPTDYYSFINWVIVGGESGPYARPMHPDWARSLRDQCAAAGVPFLFKQWGEWRPAQTIAEATNYPTIATNREVAAKTEQARRHPPASGCYHLYGQVESMIDGSGVYAHLDCAMFKAGKKAAGRLLDGRTHDEFPKGAA